MWGANGNTPIPNGISARRNKRGQNSNQKTNKFEQKKCNLPFNQNNFFGCHSMKVIPLMILIILDSHRFTCAFSRNASHGECILIEINTSIIAEGQRPVYSRNCDGSPEVDNLEATLKEFRNVRGG
jgi:hypothetical protein